MSTNAEQTTATAEPATADRDPLQGFRPDQIVVGAAGETLAQAAAAETAPTEGTGPSELVRIACDIATGAAKDPAANAIRTKGAWRDLNAKGNGSESYRRALSPGGRWRFAASERLPRGTFLASDRKACVRGDVYVGDLVADYDRSLRGGASQGGATHDGRVGLIVGPADKGAEIVWMDAIRQKGGTWRVILPTGAHLTFPAAGWR